MDVHALVVFIVVIRMVAVDRQHGEDAGQLDALTQHIGDGQIRRLGVVGSQGEHAAGHGVHDIMAGRLHDHVPCKIGGGGAALGQHLAELIQLRLGRQLTEQQQVACLLKGKATAPAASDQVFDIVAAVQQLTVTGTLDSIHIFKGPHVRNVGQTRQHALAVFVSQSGFDPILLVQVAADVVILGAQRHLLGEIPHYVLQKIHFTYISFPLIDTSIFRRYFL